MIFKVHMIANMNGKIREVNVPDEDLSCWEDKRVLTNSVLETIFYWGQNDNQPVEGRCSVSVGDVLEHNDEFYLCDRMGWTKVYDLVTPVSDV